jgi:hypothetical protein
MVTQIKPIKYPDSDGQPMADNTLQYRWIVTIQGGIDAMFKDDPNVFVAGELLLGNGFLYIVDRKSNKLLE